MARVPLQFGTGLDRDSGYGLDSPGMRDVRNVYLRNGRVELRKGHVAKSTLAGMDEIIGGTSLRALQIGVMAAYVDATGSVHLFRVDGLGAGAFDLGEWFVLEAGAVDPPRAIATENDLRAFFAHDEPRIAKRAQTVYHGPNDPEYIVGLELNEGTDATPDMQAIRFRGVVQHLEYLVGWGHGTSEEERPEMVRISLPGQPDQFHPNHYLVAGARGDAVLTCIPVGTGAGSSLLVLKGSETHHLFGSHRADFGIQLIDARIGVAGSRLAVNVGGAVFVWSEEGPRVFPGARASEDLAMPLDLRAPTPADLVAAGETEDGFALYIPQRRCIEFRFGARVYKLHLNTNPPQWTYEEVGFGARAGFQLFQGESPPVAPTGTVELDTATVLAYDRATLDVDLVGQDGDETIEVWLRGNDSVWRLAGVAEAGELPDQAITLTTLSGANTYDVALRLRRSIYYTAGYTDANPELWPSYAANAFTTPDAIPDFVDAWFERIDAAAWQITMQITPADATESVEFQMRVMGAGAFAAVPVVALPGETSVVFSNSALGRPGGARDGEVYLQFQMRHPGQAWSASFDVQEGPPIRDISSLTHRDGDVIDVLWPDESGYPGNHVLVMPDEVTEARLYATVNNAVKPGAPQATSAVAIGNLTHDFGVPFVAGDVIRAWIQHAYTSSGVTDVSRVRTVNVVYPAIYP